MNDLLGESLNVSSGCVERGGWENISPILGSGRFLMTGNEAVARAAIDSGCRFFAGYPITPSSEIMGYLTNAYKSIYDSLGGVFIQMEDEIASMGAVIGASWAGVKVMTATSGPGFSLMQENISYAIMTETPCVIVDVMRVGPSTGQATRPAAGDIMQARYGHHGDGEIIALCPASVQEAYDLTVKAFNLSEIYRVPVIILMDGFIAHLIENIVIPEKIDVFERIYIPGAPVFGPCVETPSMSKLGDGETLLISGTIHTQTGERRSVDGQTANKLTRYLRDKIRDKEKDIRNLVGVNEYFMEDARDLVITYGAVSRSALWAIKEVRRRGDKIGLLGLRVIWPFPDSLIKEYASKYDFFIVPEMNQGQLIREVGRFKEEELIIPYNEVSGDNIYPHVILNLLERY